MNSFDGELGKYITLDITWLTRKSLYKMFLQHLKGTNYLWKYKPWLFDNLMPSWYTLIVPSTLYSLSCVPVHWYDGDWNHCSGFIRITASNRRWLYFRLISTSTWLWLHWILINTNSIKWQHVILPLPLPQLGPTGWACAMQCEERKIVTEKGRMRRRRTLSILCINYVIKAICNCTLG